MGLPAKVHLQAPIPEENRMQAGLFQAKLEQLSDQKLGGLAVHSRGSGCERMATRLYLFMG